MKTKNKYITYNFPWEDGWAILAAIIAIAVLAYFGYHDYDSQEEFTIYKEECENKTIKEYYNFPNDFKQVDCPKLFLNTPCYDNKDNIIINATCLKQNINCFKLMDGNSPYSNFFLTATFSFSYIEYSWYPIDSYSGVKFAEITENAPNAPLKETKIEQVCNPVKVNEIEYTYEILAFDSECKRNCWDKYSGQWNSSLWNNCDEKCYWSILRDESISKKDITKEWLDENCICTQVTANHWNYNKILDFPSGTCLIPPEYWTSQKYFECKYNASSFNNNFWECSKYKCFENYEVKIL